MANCLIRAGFELELEDEDDGATKHCEFSARSKVSGEKYWVEAKSRAVSGILGKTDLNGTKDLKKPTNQLSKHVREALAKPSNGKRLIFTDLNHPGESQDDLKWFKQAERRLQSMEKDVVPEETTYIFVTNLNFHLHLESGVGGRSVFPYRLGVSDFQKPEGCRFVEAYKQKKKHNDAYKIIDSFLDYPKIPNTFDGTMPSEAFGKSKSKIRIGETYFFEEAGDSGLVAKVTTATVDELNKKMIVGTETGQIIEIAMDDDQVRDYLQHKDVYFGKVLHQGKKAKTKYEFFEHLVEIHLDHPPETIRLKVQNFTDADELLKLSHEDLVLEYCERLCASIG